MDARRRRGRPSEGQLVSVRLEPQVVAALDRRAASKRTTRARVLRDIVIGAVEPDDGVDRAQIQRMLRMTPAERIRDMADAANALLRFQGIAVRRR